MAITVNELQRGTADRSTKGRSYTRVFRVIADTIIDPTSASYAVPVSLGGAHPNDGLASCKDISSRIMEDKDSRLVFLVSCKYETGSGGTDDPEEEEDPLDDHPKIGWDARTVRLPVTMTSDDPPKAIVSSSGEPFDAEEDFRVLIYSYQINMATFNPVGANQYRGAINESAFTLAGLPLEAYQARVQKIAATNGERNGTRFWSVTTIVEVADDWRLTFHDVGTRQKDPVAPGDPRYEGNGEYVYAPILDTRGIPVNGPVALDGNGAPQADGADPVFLTFNTAAKPLKDFASLGLPTTNLP